MTVLAFALLAGLLAAIAGTPRGSSAADDQAPMRARVAKANALAARTMLFGHIAPDGRLDLLVGYGWERGAQSGTAMLIPSTLLVEVPSLGPQALADVPKLAGGRMLEVVVENALGIDFDSTLVVGDAKLAALLAPAGPMTVDFPDATRIDDSAGTVAFRSGRQEVQPADAMRLLVARSRDVLSHLVTVGAVLDGWQHALGHEDVARATVAVDGRALPLAMSATAKMRISTLPVARVSSGGEERFRVRADDVAGLIDHAFAWALISPGDRPRVEILNGVGDVGVTQAVARAVVPAGGEVTLTGNVPGFGVTRTQVVYYRDDAAAAARRLAKALGVQKVVAARNAIDVVDVTIIVGNNFERRSR
jgi:polyisoprenyl-teichoic acid--peptidoglycan teichoic acid transferase